VLLSGIVAVGPSTGLAQKTEQSKPAEKIESSAAQDHSPRSSPKENQQGPTKEPECANQGQTNYYDCLIQLKGARGYERQAYWSKVPALVAIGALAFAAAAAGAALWTVYVMKWTTERQLRTYVACLRTN
jgi:hypothetical protein